MISCSDLLGRNDEEEKAAIRDFLAEAWLMRNIIVHGAEYEIEEYKDSPNVVIQSLKVRLSERRLKWS